jgi:thymidylate synthase
MNRLDEQYQQLLQDILDFGADKQDRTGTGTKSIFGHMIHHNMRNGFPLLTTKKVAFKTMATELMWFLMGDTNIKYLVENGVHIWDGDCFSNYIKRYNKGEYVGKTKLLENSKKNRTLTEPFTQEEFINKIKTDDKFRHWGELGPIYGKQWRQWADYYHGSAEYTDQISILINDLKTNPDSRRLMVSAWNVSELDEMVLPPCHYGFQVYTRELSLEERLDLAAKTYDVFDPLDFGIPAKVDHDEIDKMYPVPKRTISLSWNQRSVDVFLGLPFNIASYGLLLEMIAHEVNMVPEHLIGHLGDTHLYNNHIEQAKEQLIRTPKELPTLKMSSGHNFRAALKGKADEIDLNDFILLGYEPHPTIKAPLSN